MEYITDQGANVLGMRLVVLLRGAMTATMTLFFDWIMPSWCKTAYVVFDHLFRAYRSDSSLIASKSSWRIRVPMFALWLGMCMAYLLWTPSRRLIMIYHGITGHGANLLLWSWVALQNDGPRNETNMVQSAFLDATFSYFISSFFLTYRALVWSLITLAFLRLGIPSLCLGAALYCFREQISLARAYYQARNFAIVFVNKTWDQFDYVEAQVTERLPRYLQHRWSSYQQRLPGRAKLPLYQYKPLNPGEIRLLIIKKSPFYPSVIQAEIVHRPVYPTPDYEAASYRWGSSELTEEVIVDGCRFPVTKSAFDLLLARRSVWRERIIWIDALCINQRDVQEKNEQVQLMRDIYHRASRVIVYPGGDWRSRLAGPLIYQLWALRHQFDTDSMDFSDRLDEARSPRWRAMADLFSNEYFNRAWVIQEIAVGHKVELYIGGTYIPWMFFSDVLTWCFDTKRRHMLTGSDDKDKRIWRTGRSYENVVVMTTLRPDAKEWTGAADDLSNLLNLENLLYLTFNFRAADPRDKVFGIVGIARSAGDAALTKPDYSLPVEQVFQNAARAVFSLPKERSSIHVLALAGTGFSANRRIMPSWVPDFSEERLCYPISDVLERETRFMASGDTPQYIELDIETNSLIVKGSTIDRILDLSESGPLDWGLQNHDLADGFKLNSIVYAFVQATIALCKKHSESPGAADELIRERLWSVLIGGRLEWRRADPKLKTFFQHWLRNLDLKVTARDRAHYRQLVEDGALGDGVTFVNDGTEKAYEHSVLEACFGRRIAIAVSGRFCIVPPLAKAGDSVIIPFGAQTPFLVRRCRGRHDDVSYELIGEMWVEGVMYGEMVGRMDEELIRIS